MTRAYDITSGLFGANHVWVLYADGDKTTNNRNTVDDPDNAVLGTSPWPGLPNDHLLAATAPNLAATFGTVAAYAGLDPFSFFSYSFDHGYTQNPSGGPDPVICNDTVNVLLNGWQGGDIANQQFSADAVIETAAIHSQASLYSFAECYSNSMQLPLRNLSTIFTMAAPVLFVWERIQQRVSTGHRSRSCRPSRHVPNQRLRGCQ
jgi:hypothetical protein